MAASIVIPAPTDDTSPATLEVMAEAYSPEQVLPGGKRTLYISATKDFYIVFGIPGRVAVPTTTNGWRCVKDIVYAFQTSNGSNAFRVTPSSEGIAVNWVCT